MQSRPDELALEVNSGPSPPRSSFLSLLVFHSLMFVFPGGPFTYSIGGVRARAGAVPDDDDELPEFHDELSSFRFDPFP